MLIASKTFPTTLHGFGNIDRELPKDTNSERCEPIVGLRTLKIAVVMPVLDRLRVVG